MTSHERVLVLWFIRHKPSGGYLPEPAGRMGRGGSHVEPSRFLPPRVFQTKKSAVNALSMWLKGKFTASRGRDWDGEYYEDLLVVAVVGRVRADMEIVEKEITL